MRIQHNIMAMNAYRNYTNNVSAMKANLEKLSSGYKINRAGDDAAGLAISEKMRAQITGLETAQKNAKDGISLVQTAEGALTEVHDMLNRMVELATQSANGTYDNTTDRAQLQKEVNQLRDEINRIADSSNFNGIKLLDGSMDGGSGEVSLVSGGTDYAANLTVKYDGQLSTKDPAKGKYYIDFSNASITNATTADQTFTLTLDGVTATVTVDGSGELKGADLAKAVMEALDKVGTDGDEKMAGTAGGTYSLSVVGDKLYIEMDEVPKSNVFPTMTATVTGTFNSAALNGNAAEMFKVVTEVEPVAEGSRVYAQAEFTLTSALAADGQGIQIGDQVYVFASKKSTLEKYSGGNVIDMTDVKEDNANYAKLAAQRLAKAAENNSVFKVGADPNDAKISLTEKEGGVDYEVNNLAGTDGLSNRNGATAAMDSTANNNKAWKDLVKTGVAGQATAAGKALMLQIGDTADSYNQLKVNIGDMHCKSLGLDNISIADQDSAAKAIDAIKKAINQVSDVRGTLGATQNRLDHTINNLSVMTENIQDAESTIRDTDVAEEMMAYTKNNILIQSAQAMLAQANQVPQGVLQLLG